MTTALDHRRAFAQADAILALEGFDRMPQMATLQDAIAEGKLSIDEAVHAILAAAKARTPGSGG